MGNKNVVDVPPSSSFSTTEDKSLRIVNFTDLNFSTEILSNKENITIIWLDENLDRNRDKTIAIEDFLKQINDFVRLCTDRETCIRSINLIKNEKIVLLISGSCSEDVLSRVHNLPNLDSVFVFCMKPQKYISLRSKYTKIIGIYINPNELLGELNKTIFSLTKQIAALSLFDRNDEKPICDLTKESAKYIWYQLIKDVLLKIPNAKTDYSKQDVVQMCRDYYRSNKYQLKNIDLFEQTYKPSDAITWYTKPSSFISRLINKALRTEDIDLLYLFRFFVIDLSMQLKNTVSSYSRSNESTSSTIYLYRGLKLSKDELRKLEESIGNLISTNGFLSTSRNRQVALTFATNSLFEIETDMNQEGKLWYDIADYSMIPDEGEVLFDIGATFQIESISYDSEHKLSIIHLKTTTNINIMDCLQGHNNIEILIGELYYYMGNYDKAKRYLNSLLDHLKYDYNLNNISSVNEFNQLQQNYNIEMKNRVDKHLFDNVSTLAVIANAYQRDGNFEKAIQTLKRALNLLENFH